MKFLNRKKKGFTLVELVISIGILGLVLTLTAGVLISVVRSYKRQNIIAEIERNGDFASRLIYEKARVAQSIDCVNSSGVTLPTSQCPDSTAGRNNFVKFVYSNGTVEYLGLGAQSAVLCGSSRNNYLFVTNVLADLTSPAAQAPKIITNDRANGVNVGGFVVTLIKGASASEPTRLTANIQTEQSVCDTLFEESKNFDIFITIRGTYR